MRLACPYCGPRELGEFTYLGDAAPRRPPATGTDVEDVFFDYVYLRDNHAGDMQEWWYHTGGCRAWLNVVRNTLTHEIKSVDPAAGAGASKVLG